MAERKMKLRLILFLAMAVSAELWLCSGCTERKSGGGKPTQTNVVVQAKLSDNYATSALLALKAIQRDPYVPAKGSHLVGRLTQEKIDAADVAAISNEERKLTTALQSAYGARLNLNRRKEEWARRNHWFVEVDATQYTQKQWNALVEANYKLNLAEAPQMEALGGRLDACFSNFDVAIRARSADVPASCAELMH